MTAFTRHLILNLPEPGPRVGWCALGHESRNLHSFICRRHWAQIQRERHQRRSWRRSLGQWAWPHRAMLRLWWRHYGWLVRGLGFGLLGGAFLTACAAIPLEILWRFR